MSQIREGLEESKACPCVQCGIPWGKGHPALHSGTPVEVGGAGAHGSLGLSCFLLPKTQKQKPVSEDRPNQRTCCVFVTLSPKAVEPKGE